MSDLPAPLVSADVDLSGFSGFMLDVDRLLASELVAIGTPEECWAAYLLMCRAWKQTPPGSLPNDPRVLAAFSGTGKRWAVIAPMALREFVKCSDGRLYHPVLAAEAAKAWKKRQQYGADQERLRRWRDGKKSVSATAGRNGFETDDETECETRFKGVAETVREPERQDRTGHIPPEPPSGSLPPPGATPRRGTRLPTSWAPDLVDRTYSSDQGMTEADAAAQAEKFRDYWLAEGGPKAWKRDWRAAWRTWCRRAVEHRPDGRGLLMPINGGVRGYPANGTTASRPTSGSASALAGIAAVVTAHREAS